jgi:hypothetical protein
MLKQTNLLKNLTIFLLRRGDPVLAHLIGGRHRLINRLIN